MDQFFSAAIGALFVLLAIAAWRKRRRRIGAGPASAGSFYEFLSEDKRAALEVIVEQRTGYRDPEDRDGDLPQLEDPGRADARRSDRTR
jgi:heme A synthase